MYAGILEEVVVDAGQSEFQRHRNTVEDSHNGMPIMPYASKTRSNHIAMKIGCKNRYIQKTVRSILISTT